MPWGWCWPLLYIPHLQSGADPVGAQRDEQLVVSLGENKPFLVTLDADLNKDLTKSIRSP